MQQPTTEIIDKSFAPEGYTLLEQIGKGGMSTIYLAERIADRSTVVIKALAKNTSEQRISHANMIFDAVSKIDSPYIIKLLEQSFSQDQAFTVMEYLPNGDLKHRLHQGITTEEIIQYFKQIAQGLEALHNSHVVHRDLKPGNVMFRADGSLAIIDFGIAKKLNTDLELVESHQVVGTPNYMAPEQSTSVHNVSPCNDIYSLGIMLYQMLSGEKPYSAHNGAAIIYKHIHDPIPELPEPFQPLQPLLNKMLAKLPAERFQTMVEIIEYIEERIQIAH